MTLVLERKDQPNQTASIGPVMLTPAIDEDYWLFRVRLSAGQAVVGFPKFTTIGIGFAVEEDWNTNLPYTCPAEQIYDHIEHNKGDDAITREECLSAIRLKSACVIAQFGRAEQQRLLEYRRAVRAGFFNEHHDPNNCIDCIERACALARAWGSA